MPIKNPLDHAQITLTLDLADGVANHLEQVARVVGEGWGQQTVDVLRLAAASLRTSASVLLGAGALEECGSVKTPGDATYQRLYLGALVATAANQIASGNGSEIEGVKHNGGTWIFDAAHFDFTEITLAGAHKYLLEPKAANREKKL